MPCTHSTTTPPSRFESTRPSASRILLLLLLRLAVTMMRLRASLPVPLQRTTMCTHGAHAGRAEWSHTHVASLPRHKTDARIMVRLGGRCSAKRAIRSCLPVPVGAALPLFLGSVAEIEMTGDGLWIALLLQTCVPCTRAVARRESRSGSCSRRANQTGTYTGRLARFTSASGSLMLLMNCWPVQSGPLKAGACVHGKGPAPASAWGNGVCGGATMRWLAMAML